MLDLKEKNKNGELSVVEVRAYFMERWEKYFPKCELPLISYFSDVPGDSKFPEMPELSELGYVCIYDQLEPVRKGQSIVLGNENIGCYGFQAHLGFKQVPDYEKEEAPNHTCNVLKYKKNIEIFEETRSYCPFPSGFGDYITFKRWDQIKDTDTPQIVIFYVNPDALSGLYMLAHYDEPSPNAVLSPFGTACDKMIGLPMQELESDNPKSFLGGFDTTARCSIKPSDVLIFSVPWPKFLRMVENMDNSFLNADLRPEETRDEEFFRTHFWRGVKNRLNSK